MEFKPLVYFDVYDFPQVSDYSITTATIVDGGRNVKGEAVGCVVRSGVDKIELTWNYLKAEDWSNLLEYFDPDSGGSMYNYVNYYHQRENKWVKAHMYVSDRSASVERADPQTGKVKLWKDCKLSLIMV